MKVVLKYQQLKHMDGAKKVRNYQGKKAENIIKGQI